MPVEIEVIGREGFVAVSKVMKRASPELRKEMYQALRGDVTKPIQADMRKQAEGLGIGGNGGGGGGGRGGLRHAIAMSVRNTVKDSGRGDQAGVRVESVGKSIKRGRGSQNLNWAANRGHWKAGNWGHRSKKTGKYTYHSMTASPPGWFDTAADRGMQTAYEEFQRVVEEFATRLAAQMGIGG